MEIDETPNSQNNIEKEKKKKNWRIQFLIPRLTISYSNQDSVVLA